MDPERDWEKIRNSLPSAPRDPEMQSHSQWVPQGNGAAPPLFPASEGRLALGRPEAGYVLIRVVMSIGALGGQQTGKCACDASFEWKRLRVGTTSWGNCAH